MAKTGHPNFDYVCVAPWRAIPLKKFSITGNHSGTSFGAADAQTFMTGAASPYALSFGPLQSTSVKVVGARYYDGQNSAPVWEATYDDANPAPATLQPSALGWPSAASGVLPLEVCCLLEAFVGLNSKSKPIYIRKFIRGLPDTAIQYPSGDQPKFAPTADGAAATAALGNGDWYGSRIYISPSARQPQNPWVLVLDPSNHQVPRGKKRKITSAGTGVSAESLLEKAIALAGGIVLAGA
jgi:hypothetical protein